MHADNHPNPPNSALSTQHPALDAWLAVELEEWIRAFVATLDDAIQHLQQLIFEEGWGEIRAKTGSNEEALRESVALYERGLTDLFGFVRACGALTDPVAWSTMKAEYRRAALESGTEITLRTTLETGMYAAEQAPLGDHALYLSWVKTLMLFLFQRAADAPPHPGPAAPLEEQVQWAYEALADLEEHAVFHEAFAGYLRDPEVRPTAQRLVEHPLDRIIDHEAHLMTFRRFDLILNTGLRWLAEAGGRHPIEQEWE